MASSFPITEPRLMRDSFNTVNLDLPRILALYRDEAVVRVHVHPIQPQQLPHLAYIIKDGKNLFANNMDNVFSYYEAAIETLNGIGYPREAKEHEHRRLHLKTLYGGLNVFMIMLLRLAEEHLETLDDEGRDFITFDYESLEATILPHLDQLAPWERTEAEAKDRAEKSELKTLMTIAALTESTIQHEHTQEKDAEKLSEKAVEASQKAITTEHYFEQSEKPANQSDALVDPAELSDCFAGLSVTKHNTQLPDNESNRPSPTASPSHINGIIRHLPTLSHGETDDTCSDDATGRDQSNQGSTHDDLVVDFSDEAFAAYRVQDEEETDDESEIESNFSSENGDRFADEEVGDGMSNDEDEKIVIMEEDNLENDELEPFPSFYETAGLNEEFSKFPINDSVQSTHLFENTYDLSPEPEQGSCTAETIVLEHEENSAEKPLGLDELAERIHRTIGSWSEDPRENLDHLPEPLSPKRVDKGDEEHGGHWSVPSILGAAAVVGVPMYAMYPMYTTIAVVAIIRIVRSLR
ncbi:hypothetical protein LTR84_012229 [Exophiala bonariae]|uniref:Uncharacterized protein n=1 Tax=Exophiala bonariae TaxID=1690606 RepID=A0AAV9NFK2_9EURO|nr:hypothetical protein LTR84_012229 [Exophiala bonariae]